MNPSNWHASNAKYIYICCNEIYSTKKIVGISFCKLQSWHGKILSITKSSYNILYFQSFAKYQMLKFISILLLLSPLPLLLLCFVGWLVGWRQQCVDIRCTDEFSCYAFQFLICVVEWPRWRLTALSMTMPLHTTHNTVMSANIDLLACWTGKVTCSMGMD